MTTTESIVLSVVVSLIVLGVIRTIIGVRKERKRQRRSGVLRTAANYPQLSASCKHRALDDANNFMILDSLFDAGAHGHRDQHAPGHHGLVATDHHLILPIHDHGHEFRAGHDHSVGHYFGAHDAGEFDVGGGDGGFGGAD